MNLRLSSTGKPAPSRRSAASTLDRTERRRSRPVDAVEPIYSVPQRKSATRQTAGSDDVIVGQGGNKSQDDRDGGVDVTTGSRPAERGGESGGGGERGGAAGGADGYLQPRCDDSSSSVDDPFDAADDGDETFFQKKGFVNPAVMMWD